MSSTLLRGHDVLPLNELSTTGRELARIPRQSGNVTSIYIGTCKVFNRLNFLLEAYSDGEITGVIFIHIAKLEIMNL